jgi:cytochrome c-type biogenesis protein CcmH
MAREPERPAPAAASSAAAAPQAAADGERQRPSWRLVATLSVAVLVVAVAGYARTGWPSLLRPDAKSELAAIVPADGAASGLTPQQQIAAMVDKLAARMQQHPDDAEGWTMLARSYTVLGRLPEALPAYARAVALRPKDAKLLADYADAVAASKGTANNPESIALIERALQVDPNHAKALALDGAVAYDRGDFQRAADDWQKFKDQLPPGSELLERVQASIDDARRRAGEAPASQASASALARAERPASGAMAAARASVSGVVTLDPKLAGQAAADDRVFVFARPASGSRMPLAVLRATVKDLPLSFTLDDSMAMAPGRTLSSASEIVVGARISKSGNAIPQAGDLAGETSGVAPGAKDLAIRIDRVVANP